MNPYFQKLFWKTFFRRKRAEVAVFFKDWTRKLKNRETYRFFLWKLTREGTKKRKKILPPTKKRWLFYKPRYIKIFLTSSKRPRWIPITLTLVCVSGLIAGTFFATFPVLKEYKFGKYKRTARAALRGEDYSTALLTSLTAYLSEPKEVEMLRILVKSASELSHPRTREWAVKLFQHPRANQADLALVIKSYVSLKDYQEARSLLSKIPENMRDSEEIVLLRCVTHLQNDELGEMRSFDTASSHLKNNPESIKVSEFFWDLCLNSSQAYFYQEGLKSLRKTAEGKGALARASQRRLLADSRIGYKEKKAIADALWMNGQPSLTDAVLCLDATYGKRPILLENMLFVLEQEFNDLQDPQKKRRLAELLNQIGRPEIAAQLLNQLNEKMSPDEWKENFIFTIQKAMTESNQGLVKEMMLSSQGVLSSQEKIFFDLLMDKADNLSQMDEKVLTELFMSTRLDELENIRKFVQFLKTPKQLLAFLNALEKKQPDHTGIKYILAASYQRLNDSKKLIEVLENTQMPRQVGQFSGEHQTCRLKSLHGMDLESCRSWAENALTEYPGSRSLRYTLALIYSQSGDHSSANSLLSPFWSLSPPNCPTQRLIGSWVLFKNQRVNQAKLWAPTEHASLLTDVEKELLLEIQADKK